MGPVQGQSTSKGYYLFNIFTGPTLGLLLLCIAGAHCWQWGSVKSCPPGEEPECPKNPLNDTVNYFPHPTDCHYYVQCDSNGKAICRRCSPTTYFNPHISNCVWPLDARCTTNATTRQSSLLPPICVPDRDDGEDNSLYLPEPCEDASDCSFYYRNCTERTKCPDKQHYNKKTKRCEDWCMAGCQNPLDIPDCRQCPKEGEILNHMCDKYLICTNGIPVQKTCAKSEHFDTVTKSCVPGSCCEDKPDLKNCSFYITNCDERKQCPPNQHFNAKTKQCEDFCIAGCQSPWKISQCRECQTDGEILQFDCHYYTSCVNGKPEQFKCKINEHFDQKVGKCMPGSCCEDEPDPKDCSYYITNCDQRTKCPPNQHFNRNTKRCENVCTAGCQNSLDIPQCRQCKEGEISQYECQFYSICKNGKIEQVKCNINEHFDQNARRCVPGSCCEDKPDPNDCGFYITNCNQRTPCPPNQHYNKQTKRCEDFCTAGCVNPLDIPQCRKCKEGDISQYECQFYSICKNGKIEQVKCNINEHFDQNARRCVPGSCCEDKPDPNDCGFYITNCNQSTPCPPNQHYNKNTKRCEDFCTAGCVNPLDIPQCRQCPKDGEILHYDCQFYTICKNGVPEKIECKINEHFDVKVGRCLPGSCCEDKPDPSDCGYFITNCNQRTPCPPNQHYNKRTGRCENACTAGCLNPLEIPQCRQCQTEGEVLHAICQYYTVCTNGVPQQVNCNSNEHFDATAKKCIPGPCCEDKPDTNDCSYYLTQCNQRVRCPQNQHYNKNTKRCENACTAGCQNPLEIPQCRQCPVEGQILQYECQYYSICKNGKPEQVKCNINERFDHTAQRCVPGSCCEDKPDPNDCGFYITNCNQRTPCPPYQHYNKQTKRCENVCTAGCQNPLDIPQCRQCKEGEISQYECQFYSICRNGKIEQVKCNINEHFDQNARRCVPGSCCEDKPDPNDCGFYITNCNQRTPCPPNQHYNKQTKRCEDFCTAGCVNPLDIPQCRKCKEGDISQYECQFYSICRNGKIEQVKCNINEHFDQNARRCVPGSCCEDKPDPNDCGFYITNCNQRTPCPPNQHYNRNKKRCEDFCTAGCVNPLDIPQCRQCPREGEILQHECQYYTICKNGVPTQVKCNINERFDERAHKCVPGSCCEDQPDPNDCSFYITNCNQRVQCPPKQHFNRRTNKCEDACTAGCQNPSDIPQCRQCPEGKILQSDCQYYVICRNNRPEQVKCNVKEHFDANAGRCIPGPCCEDKPDPSDCGYYITNCNQRTPCPPNQHYNRRTKRCEDKCTAGCIDPAQLPECHGECQPEGKTFEDPCSCEMYYKCQNGKKVLAMCQQGLHYNSTLGRCDAPCGDVCVKLFARKPECCASTKGKPEPQCPATKLSLFMPHPSDSRWFYQCVDGILYCNRCPPGHRWNIDEDTCDEACQCP